MLRGLPDELLPWTGPVQELDRPPQGCFYDVSILTAERGRFVLKVGRTPERVAELHDECRVLTDLQYQAPFVPKPVAHVVQEDTGFFLFTCVEGDNLLQVLERAHTSDRHALMGSLGRALKRVHSWQPATRRPTDWVGHAVETAARNVTNGTVADPIDHTGQFSGKDPRELVSQVRQWLEGVQPDLVFGHGDFCLPNALVDQGKVAGVIDWSRGGYMDRRIDLAAAVWSIRYNLQNESYVQSFLEAYGYAGGPDTLRAFEAIWILL